jgi:uncharacterized protein YbjQ (UPF0145 family)
LAIEELMSIIGVVLFIGPILVIIIAGIIGGKIMKLMQKKLTEREQEIIQKYGKDTLSNLSMTAKREVSETGIIMASLVVGPNYWQQFVSKIQSLFGGTLNYYDQVIALGRNEAMQRLREAADTAGWDEVVNVRLETSKLTPMVSNKESSKAMELFAYGTGIRYS